MSFNPIYLLHSFCNICNILVGIFLASCLRHQGAPHQSRHEDRNHTSYYRPTHRPNDIARVGPHTLSPILYNFFISFNAYHLLKCSYHSFITTAPARRPSHSITGHKTPALILFSHSPCNTINKRTSTASTRIPTSLQFQENAEIAFIRRSRSNQQRPHFHIPRPQTLTIPSPYLIRTRKT